MPTFECPICRETVKVAELVDAPFRPFCSERCKLIDLGRWLDGTYKITESTKPEDRSQAERGDDESER